MEYGGEDAYFISSVGGGAFGVADGVGGWQESGINPAGVRGQALSVSSGNELHDTVNARHAQHAGQA